MTGLTQLSSVAGAITEVHLLRSPWLGDIEWSLSAELSFPSGLPGFQEERRILPVEIPAQRPLVYLQSLTSPDVCFISLPVLVVNPEFELCLSEDDIFALKLPEGKSPVLGEDVLCLAMLVPVEGTVHANLGAPVVINLHCGTGAQCILIPEPRPGRFVLKEHGWEATC
jgi:flagellar assembly factor FliW